MDRVRRAPGNLCSPRVIYTPVITDTDRWLRGGWRTTGPVEDQGVSSRHGLESGKSHLLLLKILGVPSTILFCDT